MKKISLLVLAVFLLMTVSVAYGIDGPGQIGEIKGQGKFPSDPHRTFRLVRWMPTAAYGITNWPYTLTKDAVVIWDTSASGDDGVTITVSATSGDSRVAGVVVASAYMDCSSESTPRTAAKDIGRTNWTWLQTYGLSQVDQNPNYTAKAGDAFGVAGDGTVDPAGEAGTFLQYSGSTPANSGIAGFYVDDATAGADDVEVFVRCE